MQLNFLGEHLAAFASHSIITQVTYFKKSGFKSQDLLLTGYILIPKRFLNGFEHGPILVVSESGFARVLLRGSSWLFRYKSRLNN